ncbi:enoyl-CoA hydratase [Verminephrobacter eiseniae]|uniref:enoyl-CoA hydratase-related protein n=1 Tax=Verminephrobacter eiseniae TaxID=364317 RepID=UPI00223833BD|nr:enoyl-CoA hydratase-related protein [Verminephrobacter eiseniae]MCW5233482.1 enoyl-CoA hydratase [Verminephrobacter eiseniae]
MSDDIAFTHDGGIGVLTLNRPKSLNSLSLGAIKALLERLRAIATDDSLRALIVTGAGRGFCAGWQLDEGGVPGLPDETMGVRQAHLMQEYFNPVIQAMHDLPLPIVAAVNGVSAGAGVSIALAADIVLAADSASFVLTFAPKLGLIPDLGATWKLPRLLGWARAQAVTMLGDRISAAEAVQWGMIWRCVPDLDLRAAAADIAERLAAAPPGVCREVRQAYAAAQVRDLAAQMEFERLRQRDLLDMPSFAEGMSAFQQKRPPRFHPSKP